MWPVRRHPNPSDQSDALAAVLAARLWSVHTDSAAEGKEELWACYTVSLPPVRSGLANLKFRVPIRPRVDSYFNAARFRCHGPGVSAIIPILYARRSTIAQSGGHYGRRKQLYCLLDLDIEGRFVREFTQSPAVPLPRQRVGIGASVDQQPDDPKPGP